MANRLFPFRELPYVVSCIAKNAFLAIFLIVLLLPLAAKTHLLESEINLYPDR